jgi:hypothetical protein
MKDNNVNGIRGHILAKRMSFSLHINLNNITNNVAIRIKLTAKREMKDTNTEHTTNLI